MIESIYSTDGGSVALLRFGNVFKIGDIKDDFYLIGEDGHMKPCTLLTWDFYEDGQIDYFFFSEKNKLILSTVTEGRPDYIVREYSNLVKKGADVNAFVNVIRSVFISTELFNDTQEKVINS